MLDFLRRTRARVHAYGRRLLDQHASPRSLFWACVLGCIVGSSPFFGLHLPLCIGLAWLFRLNKVTVYGAANISIPPTLPLIAWASIQAGERLLRGRFLPMTLAELRAQSIHAMAGRFFVDWLLGGLFVGAAIGVVLGGVAYALAERKAAKRRALAPPSVPDAVTEEVDPLHLLDGSGTPAPPVDESAVDALIAAASRRYDAAPRPLRMYARFKYRLDPCYRRIAPLVPPSSITVDLGTGLGMLPLVVALRGEGRRVLGVDWDGKKIAAGRAAAEGLDGVELVEGDLRTFAIPACDAITLVDVLHYYEPAAQDDILARCAAALSASAVGGQLLLRDGDLDKRKGGWTRFVEELAVKLGWNRGDGKTKFRSAADLVAALERLGFTVEKQAVAGSLHPGNVLFVARKPATPPAPPLP